jgi:transcriptional regulator NrdR family protein
MARGRPFKCPYCDSTRTTRKGVRHTKTQGIRRLRYCMSCKRKFTPKNQKPAEEQHIEEQPEEQQQEYREEQSKKYQEGQEEYPQQQTEQPMG